MKYRKTKGYFKICLGLPTVSVDGEAKSTCFGDTSDNYKSGQILLVLLQ